MSRLEDLIQTLCPDGVEYLPLGRLCTSLTKGTLTQGKLSEAFRYPVVNSGRDYYGYYSEYNNDGNALVIASRGEYAGFISYVSEQFWAGGLCYPYRSRNEKEAQTKYLFYVLKNSERKIMDSLVARGSIPALNKADIEKVLIPLPPPPVQEEIVRILDTFTALENELEAEQAARARQYEHYRQNLLFRCTESSTIALERVMLGEICHYSKESIDASEIDKDSYVGVDNLLQNKQGKVASEFVPEKGRLIRYRAGNILIGNIRPYLKKIWLADSEGGTNGDVLCIQINDKAKTKIIPRFLYQILSSEEFFTYAINFMRGAGMPRGSKEMTMKYKFPVPPIEIQEQIVSILDRFDTLVNDLKSGLPAEIALRRKQYEYYRDKLLTFPQKPGGVG